MGSWVNSVSSFYTLISSNIFYSLPYYNMWYYHSAFKFNEVLTIGFVTSFHINITISITWLAARLDLIDFTDNNQHVSNDWCLSFTGFTFSCDCSLTVWTVGVCAMHGFTFEQLLLINKIVTASCSALRDVDVNAERVFACCNHSCRYWSLRDPFLKCLQWKIYTLN